MILDDLIIDRTQADLARDSNRSYYNAEDMNRVGAAIVYIVERLGAKSMAAAVVPRQDYQIGEILPQHELQAYLATVRALRDALGETTYTLPDTMDEMGIEEANEIERLMLYLDELITRMAQTFIPCGEALTGEDNL